MTSPESIFSPLNKEFIEEDVCMEEEEEVQEVSSGHSEHEEVEKPNREMIFDTLDEAYLYYAKFAKEKGFAVSKRTSRRGTDGNVTDLTISCVRAGKPRIKTSNPAKPRPHSKIGCPARVTVVKQEDEKWKFNVIALDHNHAQSPKKSRFFKSNRVLDECVKRQLELNDRAGIRAYKTYEALQIEAGGHDKLPFLKKDCRNYLDKQRRLRLVEGDAEAMHRYFLKMQKDNDGFFYAMDFYAMQVLMFMDF